jgi:hypothetical protein
MPDYKFRNGLRVVVTSLLALTAITTSDLTVTDDVVVTDDVTVGGDVAVDGTITGAGYVVDPDVGGDLTSQWVRTGPVALATDGAATALTLNIPTGARIEALALRVTTAVADIDSTTGTLALTGGNTETVGAVAAFTAGTSLTLVAPSNVQLNASATVNASFTLSGGADNTPSAGAVDLLVYYTTIAALD